MGFGGRAWGNHPTLKKHLQMNKTIWKISYTVCAISVFALCFQAKGQGAITFVQKRIPLIAGKNNPGVIEIRPDTSNHSGFEHLEHIEVFFDFEGGTNFLEEISIRGGCGNEEAILGGDVIARAKAVPGAVKLSLEGIKQSVVNRLYIDFKCKEGIALESSFLLNEVKLVFKDGEEESFQPDREFRYRPAALLREVGQDNCHTYRIPGIITTRLGTLIAVYDNRYNNSKDLQGDIDIGMSRSTDGGQSWEPMKVVIDMGERGGFPEERNGAGDPCVLYDPFTHTIWVAALWMSGSSPDKMLWWDSKPGMIPEETGQFVIVKSEDDGLSWSEPINITPQIKRLEWQLLLAGPGRGLTLKNGTIIFPAQFKKDTGTKAIDGGQYTCHSTIVYSQDKGLSWHIGNGAKPNTTEAQLVELSDGSIMLNMRDDLNRINKVDKNGRAVYITNDLGKTWMPHISSNAALPEPNCMASIISSDVIIEGTARLCLFFSNPDSKDQRINMSIKASVDEGKSWPQEYHLLLNEEPGFGYSCLTMINENTVGIVYEGKGSLYFQKVPVEDILGKGTLPH